MSDNPPFNKTHRTTLKKGATQETAMFSITHEHALAIANVLEDIHIIHCMSKNPDNFKKIEGYPAEELSELHSEIRDTMVNIYKSLEAKHLSDRNG